MKELVKILNDLNLDQISSSWEENIPEDIYSKYFDGKYKEVACGLDTDTHRWYETSTTVVLINDDFLGINFVSNIFSEQMDVSDCGEAISFFEMEAFQTVSYREK